MTSEECYFCDNKIEQYNLEAMNQIIKDRRVKFSAYDPQIVPELIQMIDSVLPRGQLAHKSDV